MKKSFAISLFVLGGLFSAQQRIEVKSIKTNSPIDNAEITCNKKVVGKTNAKGIYNFNEKCRSIEVSAVGYYLEDADVTKKMVVYLTPEDKDINHISAVVISDKSDPKALALLKLVNDNYEKNSPNSLSSYAFKSYDKISLDLDKDSIDAFRSFNNERIDSLKQLPQFHKKDKKVKDSIRRIEISQLIGDSQMFLWERASEFLYSKKEGEKINILDNRVAGLKQPIYELLTLRSNRTRIPKEVKWDNKALYRFYLTDSIQIDGRENYVIKFREVNNKSQPNRRKFNGFIYIDKETYGIKKIQSDSKKLGEGFITSTWALHDEKWFLQEEDMKLRAGKIAFKTPKEQEKEFKNKKDKNKQKEEDKDSTEKKKFSNYVYLKSKYFDYESPIDDDPKRFKGYALDVKNTDGSQLHLYRQDSLNQRDLATYTKIDSVGKKYKLDQKVAILTNLVNGRIKVGMFNFDATKVVEYNKYEHLRLGMSVKLNEEFNKYISPDAYFAYGFRDHTWKYGLGVDFKTTLTRNSYFRVEYVNDVMASGRFSENLWSSRMRVMNSGINLNNQKYYHYDGYKISYEGDVTENFTVRVSAQRNNEKVKFEHNFAELGREFNNASTIVSLRYSPNSKSVMTPTGKLTFEQSYPEFYANYEQSYKALGGDFTFSRLDALATHRFTTKAGITNFMVYGGLVSGTAPIWHQFAMNGLSSGNEGYNFNITSFLGFATMQGGRYFNDRFVGGLVSQRLPFNFRTFGRNLSSFDVVYKGIIGNMKHPEIYQPQFERLNRLYQELGLEYNNFMSLPISLGFFYRVGYYQTSNFKDNFAVQLKFKLLGF